MKIDKKILSGDVVTVTAIQKMHENVPRPDILTGETYKIKTPLSDHALYITINDIVLNPDTECSTRLPFEIFINSKAMEHFQWIVALTRIISAVFRKGGDYTFLVEEMRSVFDPKGGYFKKGGKYMPSLVAEIGDVLEQHLIKLGLYERDKSLAIAAQAMIKSKQNTPANEGIACSSCNEHAVIMLDGCLTCTSCGASKCG